MNENKFSIDYLKKKKKRRKTLRNFPIHVHFIYMLVILNIRFGGSFRFLYYNTVLKFLVYKNRTCFTLLWRILKCI